MAGSTRQPRHVAHPPLARPVLIYDGECAFCRRWVDRWRAAAGNELDLEPARNAADRFPEIPPAEFVRAVQLVDTNGRVYSAAEAIVRARALATYHTWLRTAFERLPGFAPIAEAVYRLVARHRPLV
jgi:predicted DCC family thiol-disulfide oxidoreductase YuxK